MRKLCILMITLACALGSAWGADTAPVAAPAKPIAPRETRRILANQEEWT
jgi:hypothetical protein